VTGEEEVVEVADHGEHEVPEDVKHGYSVKDECS